MILSERSKTLRFCRIELTKSCFQRDRGRRFGVDGVRNRRAIIARIRALSKKALPGMAEIVPRDPKTHRMLVTSIRLKLHKTLSVFNRSMCIIKLEALRDLGPSFDTQE
jgi:hypothetical protein